ncbi:glycosyltransferase family 2 protein [Vampirovibrio sp.]|uniref:glycosyltransferase family 2 protein n=1 Tax=Vampirovibrio sp. TaxID=2717857 RepID=UPI003594157D
MSGLLGFGSDPTLDVLPPLISIIMPAHNVERFIEAAIRSVLGQSGCEWELLIIDDQSSDCTAAIARGFEGKKVRCLQAPVRLGAPSAVRNYGSRFARGEYLFFFDSDDIMQPDALRHLACFIAANPHASAAYGFSTHIDESGKPLPSAGFKLIPKPDGTYCVPANYSHTWDRIAASKFVGSPNILIKKTVFQRIGGLNENFAAAEDMQIHYNLFLESIHSVGIIPAYLIQYRQHQNSLTKNTEKIESVLQAHLQVVDWLFSDPRFPVEYSHYKPFSTCKSYNYVAGVRLAQKDAPNARRILMRALQAPETNLKSWLQVCLSTFIRTLLPAGIDTHLKSLAVDLRDGVLLGRLKRRLSPRYKTALSFEESSLRDRI